MPLFTNFLSGLNADKHQTSTKYQNCDCVFFNRIKSKMAAIRYPGSSRVSNSCSTTPATHTKKDIESSLTDAKFNEAEAR